ncbi:unnamed protein product [Caenorhabditis sp. 36 PRJEB53466]|nr:unnamed protein product [Caenorhabditis sp. 36 PRJEB53466]
MQTASSSASSGMATSPSAQTKTQQPPGQQQSSQQQQQMYDPQMQYYYAAPMPAGAPTIPTFVPQNGNGQTFAPQAYYQDQNGQYVPVGQNGPMAPQQSMMVPGQQYIYMAPQQGSQQPAVMQSGQQLIYYPQHMGPMAPQTAPVYFHPMPASTNPIMGDQMGVMQQQPQQRHMGMAHGMEMGALRAAPLSSSTPLPTNLEYETMQRDNARNKNIQLRYHRVMEHDEVPFGEVSKITSDNHNDDTMSAEKENHIIEQRGDKFARRGYMNQEVESQQPSNYKTRLCMMHASGTKPCEMGSRCKFAHGLKELRSADVPVRYPNNKYKTKLCKNFARGGTGFCPYGLRCEFVHPTDKEFQNIPPYQRMMVDEKAYDQDLTPEDYVVARHQPRYTRTNGRSTTPTKVMLKHRNIAGSMMCLSQTGRDAVMAGGDFTKPNNSQENLPPHLRRNAASRNVHPPMTKRRMSLNTKWTSEENLGHHGHY